MIRRPPSSPLFPSPPLSRSRPLPAELELHLLQVARARLHDAPSRGGAAGEGHLGDGRMLGDRLARQDRKSTRLNSSHSQISYAVFCLKKKKKYHIIYSHRIS